jgi:hypothetical protein
LVVVRLVVRLVRVIVGHAVEVEIHAHAHAHV